MRVKLVRMTLFIAGMTLFGCAGKPVRVASPPQIIHVPQYLPLPDDCAIQWPVDLPPGSTAADVMLEQREVIDAYVAQVRRCFESSNGS